MQPDGHRRKAERIERTMRKLDEGPDYETIIEDCYTSAVQYIAVVCDRRRKRHMDTHKGLTKFLDDNDLPALAKAFRRLEILRTGRYYGDQGDGKAAKEAKGVLDEIKATLH